MYVFAGDGGRSVLNAGLDLVYLSWGNWATIFADAGQDAVVLATGTLDGPVVAGRDIFAAGLGAVLATPLDAGRDVVAFAKGTFFGVITTAGQDAVVIAGGDYHSGLTAGRDGFVYTFGTATGNILADEFAGAVIWGVAGQFFIEGDSGAFLANVGGFSGLVSSSDGNAGVIAMGQFTGTIEGGLDAWIVGEGSLVGDVRGGQDAGADLYGNITGSIDAGRDALVFTYASLNGSVHADRDILRVYAKNSINGSIIAERNIDSGEYYYDGWYGYASILSHGYINASISATGTSTWSGTSGHIASVVAWGRIDGSIWAAQSIDSVRSADLIGAVITAPSVGSVIANDATVLTQYPMPTVPDSILPELLQWRADALANWASQADAILLAIANTKVGVTQAISELRTLFAQQKAELEYAGEQLQDDLAQAKVDGAENLKASIDSVRRASQESDQLIRIAVTQQLTAALGRRSQMTEDGNRAYAASVEQAIKAATDLHQALDELQSELVNAKKKFAENAEKELDWSGQLKTDTFQFVKNHIPLYQQWLSLKAKKEEFEFLQELYKEIDNGSPLNEFYFYIGNLFPGMRSIQGAIDGRDPWTLERLTTFDRIFNGVTGILAVGEVVMFAGRAFNFFASPCRGGWIFGECFVGDTKVIVARLPNGSTVAMAGAGAEQPDDMSLGAACLLIGLGCAVTAFAVGNRPLAEPKQRKRKWNATLIDKVFSEDDSLNLLDDHFAEEPTLRRAGDVNPLIHPTDTEEVFSVQSPVFSEAQRFNPDASTTTTLLVPVEHRTRKTEHSPLAQSGNRKPKTSNPQSPRPLLSRGLAAIAVVLLSVGGFLSLRDYARTQPQPLIAAVEAIRSESASTPQYLSKNIRDLQTMQDKVLADNPLADQTESPLGEIVPAEWRVVVLEHTDPDGSRHIIERGMPLDELTTVTARPSSSIGDFVIDESWQHGDPLPEYFDDSGFPIDPSVVAAMLAERSAASDELVESPLVVGSTVEVDLPEHGISGLFTVTAILPCPTPNPGDGFLVTTKFIHENAEILDLRIEGSDEPIGTTASHPFWSEDRQQFVAAGDLQVGENLLLADDTTRQLFSSTLRPTRENVYNIEIDGEHVFYVGNDGVLVHNTCPYGAKGTGPLHHLVSHFANLGRGWAKRWTQLSQKLLVRVGISPRNNNLNKVFLPGHSGPHPESYHRRVFKYLEGIQKSVRGQSKAAQRAAIEQGLEDIANELLDPKKRARWGI